MCKNLLNKTIIFLFSLGGSLLAQIPNSGFENWINMGTYENPASWSTLNNKTAAQGMFTATKATPGNPGSYYLKLTSKSIGGNVVPGVAVCGKMDSITTNPLSGVTYTSRPAYFNGRWQHMIYGNSQGYIKVLLSRWNSLQGTRDTVATGITNLVGMAMSWANFVFAINYVDSLHYPDSCMIEMRASGSNPSNNDYLWGDNLSFTGTVAVAVTPTVDLTGIRSTENGIAAFSAFPVPARNELTLSFTSITSSGIIQFFDSRGILVRTIEVSREATLSNRVTIETNNMSRGIYTLVLQTGDSVKSRRVVLE